MKSKKKDDGFKAIEVGDPIVAASIAHAYQGAASYSKQGSGYLVGLEYLDTSAARLGGARRRLSQAKDLRWRDDGSETTWELHLPDKWLYVWISKPMAELRRIVQEGAESD